MRVVVSTTNHTAVSMSVIEDIGVILIPLRVVVCELGGHNIHEPTIADSTDTTVTRVYALDFSFSVIYTVVDMPACICRI